MRSPARLPPWLDRWREALNLSSPMSEPRANCSACVMVSDDDWTARFPALQYSRATRCCTYNPNLPNFLVGGSLTHPDSVAPSALEHMRRRIESSEAHPWGLVSSDASNMAYEESVQRSGFGRDRSLRCGFYQEASGACGVWAWRNATCSTWHCRYDRGMIGMGMWSAQRLAMFRLEVALGEAAVTAVAPRCDDEGWDGWEGTREAFYEATWAFVDGLDPAEVVSQLDEPVMLAAAVAQRALAVHEHRRLPEVATYRQHQVLEDLGDRARLETYTSLDTLIVPSRLVPALERFDGRPLMVVQAELAEEGVVVSDDLLQALVDFDVLR